MITYVKIERATGNIVDRRAEQSALEYRGLDRPSCWLELVSKPHPVFNPDSEKLVASVVQPDLSDLSVDVGAAVKRIEGWAVVALDAGELTERNFYKIDALHPGLFRLIEDLAEHAVTGSPLGVKALAKINTIRRLRGMADL